jgi:hypothetical protein
MTYTQIAILGVVLAISIDLWVLRTRMVVRRAFWVAYAIMVFFQLITNGMFTGFSIVLYDGDAIIGGTSTVPPPFLGDGRIAFAPAEDLLFGFSLILLSISMWVWLGHRGIQPLPRSGPPVWRRATRR